MTATTRWWWIRHAPVVNPDGVICGQLDLDADFSNDVRIETLTQLLPRDAVWLTTTLRRAKGTAARLSALAPPDGRVSEDDTLREQSFGDWEGGRWDDLPAEIGDAYWGDPVGNRPPGGESFADVATRVAGTVNRLIADHRGRDIVAVAHAGSIRAALGLALGGDPRAALTFRIDPLSLTRIDAIHRDGRTWWRVAGVNLPGNRD